MRQLRVLAPTTACLAAAFTFACSPAEGPDRAAEVRDSAGIRIVESWAPVFPEGRFWTLDPEPMLDIGGDPDDPTQFLYNVVGAFQVSGTREVAVANRGSAEVFVYDSVGSFVRAIGGRGDGPGEITNLFGIYPCDGGHRFLVSEGKRRVSVFDVGGDFIRVVPHGWEDVLPLVGVSSDCSSILFKVDGDAPEVRQGVLRSMSAELYWGDLESGTRTLLGGYSVGERLGGMSYGRPDWKFFPWATQTLWTVSRDRVYLATGERFEVQVLDRKKGLVEVIRWNAESPIVTQADLRLARRNREFMVAASPSAVEYFEALTDTYVPERKPTTLRLLLDDRGNLWVQEYPFWHGGGWGSTKESRLDADPVSWTVFDPSGILLGTIEIPAEIDVYSVQNDHVLGLWKDDLDVQHVRLYRLNKG